MADTIEGGSNKGTFYLGLPLQNLLRFFHNRSGRLNEIADRYGVLLADATPALTEGQWSLLCRVLLSSARTTELARLIWAEIADCEPAEAELWGVDVPAFAAELRGMSHAQRIACLEVVDRFWAYPCTEETSFRDRLHSAGARFAKGKG